MVTGGGDIYLKNCLKVRFLSNVREQFLATGKSWGLVGMHLYHAILLWGLSAGLAVLGAPNCGHYSFPIGGINATVVSDGSSLLDPSSLAPDVSPEDLEQALTRNFLPVGEGLVSHFNPLHLDMGERKVMVDVGSANTFGPTLGKVLENLVAAGLDPNSVTDILITHSHLDHIGGVLKPDGSLAFPNAKVFVGREDYEFWINASADSLQDDLPLETRQHFVNVAQTSLNAVSDRLEFFEPETEVIPGIISKDLSGHAPGMSGFLIT